MRTALLVRTDGQASVEAALLLPAVLLVLGMLLQPACLLYTRMVMEQAAAETGRLLVTASCGDDAVRAFCIRRLSAVPAVSLFHVGGADDWQIEFSERSGYVEVAIRGHARPLPVFGMLARLAIDHDDQGIVLAATYAHRLRPSWLGGDVDAWMGVWDR